MKEPRKVLYEDKDLVSTVSYTLKENHDAKESGNVGDTTDMLERTENGWCIFTGVCILFLSMLLSFSHCLLWVCFMKISGTKYENQDGDNQFQQKEISSMSGEKVFIVHLLYDHQIRKMK